MIIFEPGNVTPASAPARPPRIQGLNLLRHILKELQKRKKSVHTM